MDNTKTLSKSSHKKDGVRAVVEQALKEARNELTTLREVVLKSAKEGKQQK